MSHLYFEQNLYKRFLALIIGLKVIKIKCCYDKQNQLPIEQIFVLVYIYLYYIGTINATVYVCISRSLHKVLRIV